MHKFNFLKIRWAWEFRKHNATEFFNCVWFTLFCFEINFIVLGNEFVINKHVRVVPTPGHTLTDVSVLVTTPDKNIVAISGKFYRIPMLFPFRINYSFFENFSKNEENTCHVIKNLSPI